MSDQLARQALKLLSANIRTAWKNGRDIEARGDVLLGSMLTGMAFANSPVAAMHALAYPIHDAVQRSCLRNRARSERFQAGDRRGSAPATPLCETRPGNVLT